MAWYSKIMWAVCLTTILALAAHLMGVVLTLAISSVFVASFVRRVGWRRAIFPFTARLG